MKSKPRLTLFLTSVLFALTAIAQTTSVPPADAHFQIPATDDGLPGAGPIRRYDWFRQLWSQRRSTWARHTQQDQGAVVFLGDSITQMWGDDLGAAFLG